MNLKLKSALGIAALLLGAQARAQITFYEGEGFRGRAFTTNQRVGNFERFGFNDRARSVVVDSGRWEACEDARFEGRCVVLRRGSYDSLERLGLEGSISSVRPLQGNRPVAVPAPEPLAAPTYEYRRRPNERVYEAPITSVRAVVGPPNQRCWMERQQVQAAPSQSNVGGLLLGGLIGGVLGHQVGGGTGNDLATVAGAVGGAVVGNNMAGGSAGVGPVGRDVQRCETTQNTKPDFWDVTYNYRGAEHHVQMTAPPVGNTIIVNANGLPRQ
ncbi:beta/gamma crystallin-related protein [Caenimonas terrae]|uniref:Beta/gamma crystallin-related protein n=1 Tax=Caenimonas terrae TaxID=696074 RepID=A0ABW0NLB2_9BURK